MAGGKGGEVLESTTGRAAASQSASFRRHGCRARRTLSLEAPRASSRRRDECSQPSSRCVRPATEREARRNAAGQVHLARTSQGAARCEGACARFLPNWKGSDNSEIGSLGSVRAGGVLVCAREHAADLLRKPTAMRHTRSCGARAAERENNAFVGRRSSWNQLHSAQLSRATSACVARLVEAPTLNRAHVELGPARRNSRCSAAAGR